VIQLSSGHIWCQHQYQYHLLNYWRNVWRVQKCTWKWSCWKDKLFRVAVDPWISMDISMCGYQTQDIP